MGDSEANSPVEAARNLLAIGFQPEDNARIEHLSGKAHDGSLTPAERAELDNYVQVAHLLALLQSKARMLLKRAGDHG